MNVRDPLRTFYPYRIQRPTVEGDAAEDRPFDDQRMEEEQTLVTELRPGESIDAVVACFAPQSEHWSAPPPDEAPVMFVFLQHFRWMTFLL